MGFKLGKRSRQRLEGVDPSLVRCVELALDKCPFDFTVSEGLRSKARQAELYAQGRTTAGKKVTWTMNSKHCQGKAVDIIPCGLNPYDDKSKFSVINKCMLEAAAELGIKVRWGADWDMDSIPWEKGEYDGPHWELV